MLSENEAQVRSEVVEKEKWVDDGPAALKDWSEESSGARTSPSIRCHRSHLLCVTNLDRKYFFMEV